MLLNLEFLHDLPAMLELDVRQNKLTSLTFPTYCGINYVNVAGNALGLPQFAPLK